LSFEIKKRDLRGRIGRLKTKSGSLETPLFLPVVHPVFHTIPPRRLSEEFRVGAVMTNAYLMRKNLKGMLDGRTVHELLNFPGVIMTDSGAYQILSQGEVTVTPKEIIRFQEEISTDIGVILDQPTSWRVTWREAKRTVETTLKRAEEALGMIRKGGILWTGPVQGGVYLDLVELSAERMSELPFDLYALGSPTTLMQNYWFSNLIDMIATAISNLPVERPMHLFGAGHPIFFSFAVALGCDIFDSAAYAIYARRGRYMTEQGTDRIDRLKYFPCSCPVCSSLTPRELRGLPQVEREMRLAEHNLYSCIAEINRIKQAIVEGRLWELMELRSRSHPSLLSALKNLRKYESFLEKASPISKPSGLFYFGSTGLYRPEIIRHKDRIENRYHPPSGDRILLLISQPRRKPFHDSPEVKRILGRLSDRLGLSSERLHICFYCYPFGVVPEELDEVYPLSQNVTVSPCDKETIEFVEDRVRDYILRFGELYRGVVFLNDRQIWGKGIVDKCRNACEIVGSPFILEETEKSVLDRDEIDRLSDTITDGLSEPR